MPESFMEASSFSFAIVSASMAACGSTQNESATHWGAPCLGAWKQPGCSKPTPKIAVRSRGSTTRLSKATRKSTLFPAPMHPKTTAQPQTWPKIWKDTDLSTQVGGGATVPPLYDTR
eukprot:166136-Prymnesium_polylepis.1